ncbi:MAG TPA: hypothetical protein VF169_03070 [Albitalea sp.]|uniref:hypothetical protein n=1 Tax=Piscinibacter sp. TaxID=1903157 RepID=UPI002ED37087
MTPATRALAERIVAADRLFASGQFEACHEAARALLDELGSAAGDPQRQWRAELLGLVGRSALQLGRLDEALAATREALQGLHALDNDALDPLLQGLRENLMTILAARESPDDAGVVGHRAVRKQILYAQALTNRCRFAQSIDVLQPLREGLQSLGTLPSGERPPAEPGDVRLWYLPRVLGLLGFDWFHRGDLAEAKALTAQAVSACRALGDTMGERVYQASLATMDTLNAPSAPRPASAPHTTTAPARPGSAPSASR